ncbi:MAG: hypothetical protein QGG00_06450 [Verrucomicrobiota bacterium]|jgi:hypothetical protein|nr:hypothetical protein [Verrucomicrobiota bacterium]
MKTSNIIILTGVILYISSYCMPAVKISNFTGGSSTMHYGWDCAVMAILPGIVTPYFAIGIVCTIANLFMIITPIFIRTGKVTEKFRRFHYYFSLSALSGCIVAETLLIGFYIWILSMFIVNYGISKELNTQNQANFNDLKEDNVRRRGLLKNIDEQIALMIGVAFLILWLAGCF